MKPRFQAPVILALILILAALFISSSNARTTQSLHTGMVAYYSFDDGTARDSSGYGNHGTIYGGATSSTGIVGNSLSFDGSDDFVQVPHAPSLGLTSEFTIAGWAKPVSVYYTNYGWVKILTKANTSSMFSSYAVIYYEDGTQINPYIRFTSDQNQLIQAFLPYDGMTIGTWNFFVWRFSGGTLEIFKGTTKIGEEILGASTLGVNTLPLEIGRDEPGEVEFFHGELDEIRIYNRAISNTEIQELYQQANKPTGYLTSPIDDISLGPVTLPLTANIIDSQGVGVKRVEFVSFYDGSWHSAGIDESSPYESVWQTPNKLRSQQIRFGIHVVDSADNRVEFAGGVRRVNYLEHLGNPQVDENWVPLRAYLNQRSLQPNGDDKCSAASMTMMLAMNGLLSHEYVPMRDKANQMYPKVLKEKIAYLDLMVEELNRQGMTAQSKYYNTDDAWNAIKAEINNGRPVIIRTEKGVVTEAGHLFVAVGYRDATGSRQVIAYDPFGRWIGTCCPTNYDLNSRASSSRKGQWVSYDFDLVFGSVNYLITAQPATSNSLMLNTTNVPTTPPDFITDEPENIGTYVGIDIFVDEQFIPLIIQ